MTTTQESGSEKLLKKIEKSIMVKVYKKTNLYQVIKRVKYFWIVN